MSANDHRLQILLEKAAENLEKTQKETEHTQKYLNEITDMFTEYAKEDTSAYFFLGTMYMPKINHPFPDDYEKAIMYFEQVDKGAGLYWQNAMANIGMYFYQVKKDYLRAACYFSLVMKNSSQTENKKVRNYYDICLGKIGRRSYWMKQMKLLSTQKDIENVIISGNEGLVIRCPKCHGTECAGISPLEGFRRMLGSKIGMKRIQDYHKYRCRSCGHEWI